MTAAVDARAVLAAAVERAVILGHDGRSGSTLERVRLADGTALVLKRSRAGTDLAAVVTGGADRELALLETGVLDRLPPGVGHALVGGWREDGEVVLLMRDVGPAIPGWGRILDRDECHRVLTAAAGVHSTFAAGPRNAAPVAAGVRATALWPHRMRALAGMANPLPEMVLRGWSRFTELVAGPVADAVARLQADPAPLLAEVDRRPATLLHGDLWLVNLALEPGQVTLLDWSLATWGPPLMEFATFLTGAFSQVNATREELVDDVRATAGLSDTDVDLMLLLGLMELGWNKALDAAEHPDPAKRAHDRAELAWWVDLATPAMAVLLGTCLDGAPPPRTAMSVGDSDPRT